MNKMQSGMNKVLEFIENACSLKCIESTAEILVQKNEFSFKQNKVEQNEKNENVNKMRKRLRKGKRN